MLQGTLLISTTGGTLTLKTSVSQSYLNSGDTVTHTLAKGVKVTLDGAASTLSALKPGDYIHVSGSPITEITAKRSTA